MKNKIENTRVKQIGNIILQNLVPQAIQIIQDECHDLTIIKKVGYDGVKPDLAINGDRKAQEMYMREIAKHFPDFGIIAEEDGVAFDGKDNGEDGEKGEDIYFTIDPLDGTKAYERGAGQGVGTMIALCKDNDVIAAYIGDANTGETYGFADMEKRGAAIRQRFGVTTNLKPRTDKPLAEQYVLLREMPRKQPELINKMINDITAGGLFKDAEVTGGSIGTAFARLWKGEVGAMVLQPGFNTPWDLAPTLGISRRLGYKFFKLLDGKLIENEPMLTKTVVEKPYTEIVVHEAHEKELMEWLKVN